MVVRIPELETLVELATADPVAAMAQAEGILASEEELHPVDEGMALWALGLGAREQMDLELAHRVLSRASAALAAEEEHEKAAQVRSSLAVVLIRQGELDAALDLIEEASAWLTGLAAARNQMQMALALQRKGDVTGASQAYDEAIEGLLAGGDVVPAAGALGNVGVMLAYQGLPHQAVRRLERSIELARQSGQRMLEAMTLGNLAFVYGRMGSVAESLERFEVAARLYEELRLPAERIAVLGIDRAEVLGQAGLFSEAIESLEHGIELLRAAGSEVDTSEALLLAARVALVAGDHEASESRAAVAEETFVRQGRHSWALIARLMRVAARPEADLLEPSEMDDLVRELRERGWYAEARQAELVIARRAARNGDIGSAERILSRLAEVDFDAPILERVESRHAAALLAMAQDDLGGCRQALDEALLLLDEYRATIGSVELRAHAAVLGRELFNLALHLVSLSDDPWQMVDAVERWRAASLRAPPPSLPDDPELHESMARLRNLETQLHAGHVDDVDSIRRERRHLEDVIRHRMRRSRPQGDAEDTPFSRSAIEEALDGRTLLSFAESGDRIHAISIRGDEANRRDSIEWDRLDRLATGLTFTLQRLARSALGQRSPMSETSAHHAREAFETDTTELRDLILDGGNEERDSVIVIPTGVMHRLPWTAIGGKTEVLVAPSISAWLRAERLRRPLSATSHAGLIAGPDLPGARREVERLSRLYPVRTRLTGRNATCDRVIQTLEEADIVHLAAHGTFRSDNPLFSSLRLADGPLTVYELEQLTNPPSTVIMPSCDTGVSDVLVGDEILGFASALLHLGVSTIVAPIVPIPDEETGPLMIELHRRLLRGGTAQQAIAAMYTDPERSTNERIALSAFVVIGS